VREFVGHGVGRVMHEEPQVPNFVDAKIESKAARGMTLAIEPIGECRPARCKNIERRLDSGSRKMVHYQLILSIRF